MQDNSGKETANFHDRRRLPKLIGCDTELANFMLHSGDGGNGAGHEAALRVLDEIRRRYTAIADTARLAAVPGNESAMPGEGSRIRDPGRCYLPSNGGCCYIDCNHLELCTPEVLSASDYVAAWHAMLRIARDAMHHANVVLGNDRKIVLIANNSDGQGASYGGHINLLVSRRCWDSLMRRSIGPQVRQLISYQVSSMIFTGQGKVGAENGRPAVPFQISQRADFIETLLGGQTTFRRPIVNSRDESLAGSGGGMNHMARYHNIFYDTNLAHTANYLKVGVLQIILAQMEAGCLPSSLVIEDPLDAVHRFSHDPDLRATVRLANGGRLSAVEIQQGYLEAAHRFVDGGGSRGYVPEAARILETWERILVWLAAGDFDRLGRHLDWVLKRILIEQALAGSGLGWETPQAKYLDLVYASLDPGEGLYWLAERCGAVDRMVRDDAIVARVHEPPEDTRAWMRAMLLRRAGGAVTHVNWDSIRLRHHGGSGNNRTVSMNNPLGGTRSEYEQYFRDNHGLDAVLQTLSAIPATTLTGELP